MGLLDTLNAPQREAAETTEGALLVLAGAGSGKTRVLTHRVAHILAEKRAEPWQILAVTFTNKAAREMRERLETLVGPEIREAWIGTFHAMCARILRREAERLGYSRSFTIYDTDDTERTMKRVLERAGFDLKLNPPSAVLHAIDRGKNQGLMPSAFTERFGNSGDPYQRAAARFYGKYQDALRSANAMDFGDLLLLTVVLLRDHPDIRQRYARRFRYLLVDEFQDTNAVQSELLDHLSSEHKNLMVVGDDDQSIYRWRGAEVRNILDFPRLHPGSKTVTLEQNYRSTSSILEAANRVIARNKDRHPKRLFTEQPGGEKIGVGFFDRGDEEAIAVAQSIAARVQRGQEPQDFAILYRMNAQSRLFEEALRRYRVPYIVIGATAFFERKEVKDVLAYLRLIVNPHSHEDLERVMNVPPRKLGKTTLERLRQVADATGLSGVPLLELPAAELESKGINRGAIETLRGFAKKLRAWSEAATSTPGSEIAKRVIREVGYLAYLESFDADSAEDRVANVEELVSGIAQFEEEAGRTGASATLADFLEQAALQSSADKDSERGAVSLLTVHAAKGLEFPIVFVVGLEERTFPSNRAIQGGEQDIAEERRLCYVAFTRAMRELHLTAARSRRMFGTLEVFKPSRFFVDLPDNLVTTFGRPDAPQKSVDIKARAQEEPVLEDVPEPVARHDPGGVIRVGQAVKHNTFGQGRVTEIDREGPKTFLTVEFPNHGTKRIVSKFVEPV